MARKESKRSKGASTVVVLSAALASMLGSGAVLLRAGITPAFRPESGLAGAQEQRRRRESHQEAPSVGSSSLSPLAANQLMLDPARIEMLSDENPRAIIARGVLTEEECEHLKSEAYPRLHRSGVVDTKTGQPVQSSIRTSSGAFLPHSLSDIATGIERKIALLTQTPVENGEALQVLRYEPTQEYQPHLDYFHHESAKKNNRLVTALMYLGQVDRGGETVFPLAPVPESQRQSASNFTECGMRGLSVRPNKGDVLVFWSMKPGGELDPASRHGSCPVVEGEKWTATRWIHVGTAGVPDANHRLHKEDPRQPSKECTDDHSLCDDWAMQGECSNNPGYMLRNCRFSCRQCEGIFPD